MGLQALGASWPHLWPWVGRSDPRSKPRWFHSRFYSAWKSLGASRVGPVAPCSAHHVVLAVAAVKRLWRLRRSSCAGGCHSPSSFGTCARGPRTSHWNPPPKGWSPTSLGGRWTLSTRPWLEELFGAGWWWPWVSTAICHCDATTATATAPMQENRQAVPALPPAERW